MTGSDLRVLIAPWMGERNPYLPLLAAGLEANGVRVDRVSGSSWSALADAVGEHGTPDVLHLHWQHGFLVARRRGIAASIRRSLGFFEVLRNLRRRGTAIVWTVHNLSHHEGHHARWERAACRILARMSHRLVVHCEAARSEVAACYRVEARRIAVIPHGHYMDAYPPPVPRSLARRRTGLEQSGRVVLFFGQIREYKGIPELLAVLDAPDVFTLVVAGEARETRLEEVLRERAGRDARLRLELGAVDDARLADLVDACDAVALPYRRSLTSGSAMLAGSRGRPVVAPRMGCMEEMAGQGAILYDDEEGGLARALRAALSLDLDALGARFLERVRPLTWESVGAMTRDAYLEAWAGAGRP